MTDIVAGERCASCRPLPADGQKTTHDGDDDDALMTPSIFVVAAMMIESGSRLDVRSLHAVRTCASFFHALIVLVHIRDVRTRHFYSTEQMPVDDQIMVRVHVM